MKVHYLSDELVQRVWTIMFRGTYGGRTYIMAKMLQPQPTTNHTAVEAPFRIFRYIYIDVSFFWAYRISIYIYIKKSNYRISVYQTFEISYIARVSPSILLWHPWCFPCRHRKEASMHIYVYQVYLYPVDYLFLYFVRDYIFIASISFCSTLVSHPLLFTNIGIVSITFYKYRYRID